MSFNNKETDPKYLQKIIAITAVISFSISALIFTAYNYLVGRYSLVFDKNSVSIETINKFNKVRSILQNSYYEQTDTNELLEGAMTGMANSLKDPYTDYKNKGDMKKFMDLQKTTQKEFVGIGVNIILDKNGTVTILEPYDDSPAKAAGIKHGDKILKIDGKDIAGIKNENIVADMIKGRENTEVMLTILRESDNSTVNLRVIRKKIVAKLNIYSEMVNEDIAYIKIKLFDENIGENFISQLNKLIDKGAKSLIIDVRDNPGGLYDEVVKIANRLLPKGTIVYTKDRSGKKDEKKSDATELNMPIVVLTNGNSASASEILAGAIKDFNKGMLIGTKTFGKGLVQVTYQFDDGTGLKVTVARFYTPSGVCIQGEGIKPNIEVKVNDKYKNTSTSEIPRQEDLQLQKAIETLKNISK